MYVSGQRRCRLCSNVTATLEQYTVQVYMNRTVLYSVHTLLYDRLHTWMTRRAWTVSSWAAPSAEAKCTWDSTVLVYCTIRTYALRTHYSYMNMHVYCTVQKVSGIDRRDLMRWLLSEWLMIHRNTKRARRAGKVENVEHESNEK